MPLLSTCCDLSHLQWLTLLSSAEPMVCMQLKSSSHFPVQLWSTFTSREKELWTRIGGKTQILYPRENLKHLKSLLLVCQDPKPGRNKAMLKNGHCLFLQLQTATQGPRKAEKETLGWHQASRVTQSPGEPNCPDWQAPGQDSSVHTVFPWIFTAGLR